MKLISEEAVDIEFLTEAKKEGGKNYFIEGVFMQAETKNRNGRVYPKGILQKEAKRYSEKFIKNLLILATLDHNMEIRDKAIKTLDQTYNRKI